MQRVYNRIVPRESSSLDVAAKDESLYNQR
jgi:hypothetical protein